MAYDKNILKIIVNDINQQRKRALVLRDDVTREKGIRMWNAGLEAGLREALILFQCQDIPAMVEVFNLDEET